ncbi:MAG: sigma-54-dependent Fis family transcriptional regulator [Deltaproteobacteria bacterium]|nr:sigma-54-dependent Fis family transcriptional regulator [Deltaproteobacteria bacterium]
MGNKKNKQRYNVSLYILIPVIFSGMSILTGIIAFQLSKYYPRGVQISGDIALWAAVIIVVTFLCGFLITRLILSPMKKFVQEAERMSLLTKAVADKKQGNVNEIDHFNLVFKEISSLLDKVEAKELFPDMVGQSRVMRGLFSQIMKVAATDATVLIMGDSGTGKELVASSIHKHSKRRDKPFVKLSCVAIPEGLLESELFGHEKGAFTGATSQKTGKFELANEGTILLDEIGDMPMETQAKLLRVLQEREFERVGGTRPIKIDVRFISASNKDLPEMVKEGKFREDLYYRINAVTLNMPRLAERREDIPLLIDYFLKQSPKKARISSDALQMLMNYSWPGNVRELKNTVERVALMSDAGIIEPANIPVDILSSMKEVGYGLDQKLDLDNVVSIDDRLANMEKKMIVEALISTRGVQARAAEILGINERSLYHRIKKHEIDIASLKP